jgi:hypothetical protein
MWTAHKRGEWTDHDQRKAEQLLGELQNALMIEEES